MKALGFMLRAFVVSDGVVIKRLRMKVTVKPAVTAQQSPLYQN